MRQAAAGVDDDALMARVAMRDAAAFRVLVEAHGRLPQRIAWRMIGDRTEAEDIAQEALLRLWDQAPRWRPGGGGVPAWLSRVAVNLSLDRLRRRKFASDAEPAERADDAPLADALLEREHIEGAVRAAIAALPDRQRATIVLTYYEDCSNRDAATMLDMNLKAFESLLLRARKALGEELRALGIAGAGGETA